MTILIQSFGFKYGIPVDCDNVIDVRFIPNPFYIDNLKAMSGLDDAVRDYVMGFDETRLFMDMQESVIEFAIPFYIREGKVRLTIGVGCTGGRHRSVVLAEDLANRLRDNHLRVVVDHRDIDKDPQKPRNNEQASSC
jgi:RNase adapter protein RapZ